MQNEEITNKMCAYEIEQLTNYIWNVQYSKNKLHYVLLQNYIFQFL